MELPQRVIVKQEIEPLEIFSGIESKNKYSINSETGEQLMYAYEDSHFAARFFLKKKRPLELKIIDNKRNEIATVKRPWYFWFPSHTVSSPNGVIGEIHRKFALINKHFDVQAGDGTKYICTTKVPKVWTYNIEKEGQHVAQINKKWSGGRELFTDADTFQIDFGSIKKDHKRLILALALAIDLSVFERR